jgi:hypothetical protein
MPGAQEHEHKRVEPISGSEPRRQVENLSAGDSDETAVAKAKFDKAVNIADPTKVELRQKEMMAAQEVAVAEGTRKESLVDLARKTAEAPKAPPTIKEIDTQATQIRKDPERPRAQLMAIADLNVALPGTAKLSAHIEHMDRALRDVSKLSTGVEAGTLVDQEKPPLVRFLKYLTESDKRLSTAVDEINALNNSKERLTPEKLIAVQVKLNFIQQELEFFSSTLSKAVESVKTIMNVQI